MSKQKARTEEGQMALDLGGLPGNHIAITGKIRYTRHQAHELISLLGGIPDTAVTKRTRYLVAGKQIHAKSEDGKTIKLRKAQQYQASSGVEIISEQEFFQLLKDAL